MEGGQPVKFSTLSVNRTARKLRLRVPSALRAPAAGYLIRLSVRFDIPPVPAYGRSLT